MSLSAYHHKRKFPQTPEPKGRARKFTNPASIAKQKEPLTFVIQKHQASSLHYDFRLELNGVLKSWAVPKGPSLNPEDKRLAMMVEDHPMEYAKFEGIIPKGNYGAGTVMVWDQGIYMSRGLKTTDRKETEKDLKKQLAKGHLTFVMLGKKLQGEFALIKTPHVGENAWLLVKKGDEYATKKDILKADDSVVTNRSMQEIAKQSPEKHDVWFSKPKQVYLSDAPKSKMPRQIKPMLAGTAEEPFNHDEWIFELKWDGYRQIAEIESGPSAGSLRGDSVEPGRVKLYSRNHQSYNEKFAPIAVSLAKFPGNVVLDGEVVIVDKNGHPNFQWLQDYPKSKQGELIYYVFDILYYDGHKLDHLPLIKRKQILQQVLPPFPHIKYSDHIETSGIEFFRQAHKLGLEGIMAKKANSVYKPGERSDNWLKIKPKKHQEAVIAGFTSGNGGRKNFGALVLGICKGKKLHYIGHTGGGFNDKTIEEILQKLQPLAQAECPFDTKPPTNGPVTWVKPVLVAEVTFSSWTEDHIMRHPIFVGLQEQTEKEKIFAKDTPEKGSTTQIKIAQRQLKITNLEKVFWPKEGYTKGDLIDYYREIAPVILPYLKNRPQSLLRFPNGIEGESFFQKDSSNLIAPWIKRVKIHSESNDKDVDYLLCQDEAVLIYLINLGCIDLNPWNSRTGHLDKPDYLVIDLDPEDVDFAGVIKVALATREVLEQLEIPSFPKTSGARGMHIYIPIGAKYTYEQTRLLAELLCMRIHKKTGHLTSMIRNPKDRQGKVYLDFLQNIKGQTLASVYSVRAKPGATVSTPLWWAEVTPKLHPSQFTIKNIPKRVQSHGDLFKGVLGKGIELKKILKNLENTY